MIENNAERIEPLLVQMEQWSILSNTLNYIKYDKHPKNFHNLGISAVNVNKKGLDTKKEKGYGRDRCWSNTGCIKRGISQCILRKSSQK